MKNHLCIKPTASIRFQLHLFRFFPGFWLAESVDAFTCNCLVVNELTIVYHWLGLALHVHVEYGAAPQVRFIVSEYTAFDDWIALSLATVIADCTAIIGLVATKYAVLKYGVGHAPMSAIVEDSPSIEVHFIALEFTVGKGRVADASPAVHISGPAVTASFV
jgi:hypothetical protein